MDDKTLVILAAAVGAGYLTLRNAILWADQQILIRDELPPWLLDLSLASTQEDAAGGLLSAWQNGNNALGDVSLFDRLCLGFLFLRYERGDLGLKHLLTLAWQTSDGNDCGIECWQFFTLLDELEDGIPLDAIAADVRGLFEPLANLARGALGLIQKNPDSN